MHLDHEHDASATSDPRRPSVLHRWTRVQGRELMTHVHMPAGETADVVVVLADALGRDEVVGYRPYRMLAERLAESGAAAVRFAWSGTADSSDPDDDRPCTQHWNDDLAAIVDLARTIAPGAPVAVVGLRAAALLVTAYAGSATPAPSQIVLWEPVGSGRQWLRSQSTLHKVSAEFRGRTLFPTLPEGSVEIPGRLVSCTDAEALRALKVQHPQGVVVDVVKRPALLVDRPLAALLKTADQVIDVDGQEAMFDAPTLLAEVDVPTLDTIVDLVRRGEPVPVHLPEPRDIAVVARSGRDAGHDVVEEITTIDGCHAVITRAVGDADKAMVAIPAAGEPMDGPTALWTRLARDAAGRGVTSLRLDRHGAGEGGDPSDTRDVWPYRRSAVDDFVTGVDHLRTLTGTDPVVVGMCSGAWLATQVALHTKIPAVVAINQIAWDVEARPEGNPIPAQIDTIDAPGVFPGPDDPAGATPTVPLSIRLRRGIKQRVPAPVWSLLARRGAVQMAGPLFDDVTRRGTAIHQIFGDYDLGYVDGQQMKYVMRRLALLGRDVTILRRPELDHSLLSYASRERAISDILSVINRLPGASTHRS